MRRFVGLSLGLLLAACGPVATPPPAAVPTLPLASATTSAASAAPVSTGSSVRELPEVAKELEAEGVSGTIALYDSQDGSLGCSDLVRCQKAYLPASTFKIPNSMIALENGVVEGPDTLMKWDGKQYDVEAWNRDLTFRDAFRVSCLPCYQAVARQVGERVEQEWVNKLDYGNHDTSGGVDRFWVWGGLRITPLQQIDFLRRFDAGKLPISERTSDIVKDIMVLDVTESYVLRAKTGTASKPEESMDVAWFVGWLESGERRVFFATLIDSFRPGVDLFALRRRLTERVLRARGLM